MLTCHIILSYAYMYGKPIAISIFISILLLSPDFQSVFSMSAFEIGAVHCKNVFYFEGEFTFVYV